MINTTISKTTKIPRVDPRRYLIRKFLTTYGAKEFVAHCKLLGLKAYWVKLQSGEIEARYWS